MKKRKKKGEQVKPPVVEESPVEEPTKDEEQTGEDDKLLKTEADKPTSRIIIDFEAPGSVILKIATAGQVHEAQMQTAAWYLEDMALRARASRQMQAAQNRKDMGMLLGPDGTGRKLKVQ